MTDFPLDGKPVPPESSASDDVVLTLVKDGDHRLSRPADLDRLIAAVEGVSAPD